MNQYQININKVDNGYVIVAGSDVMGSHKKRVVQDTEEEDFDIEDKVKHEICEIVNHMFDPPPEKEVPGAEEKKIIQPTVS